MFGLENLLDEKDISLPPSRDVWPTYVGHISFLGFHLWIWEQLYRRKNQGSEDDIRMADIVRPDMGF